MKCEAYARRTGEPCRREAVEGEPFCVFHAPRELSGDDPKPTPSADLENARLAEVVHLAPPVALATPEGCIRALEETAALVLQGVIGTRAGDVAAKAINAALRYHQMTKPREPEGEPEHRVITFQLDPRCRKDDPDQGDD